MALITDLAAAITRQENVDPKYNNPGGIWDSSKGTIKTYATYDEGYQALLNTINSKVGKGYNLYQFFGEYAPSGHGDNNPTVYAQNVSSWTGIDPNVPLNQVSGSNLGLPTVDMFPLPIDLGVSLPSMPIFSVTTNLANDSMPWILGALAGGLLYMLSTDSGSGTRKRRR